MSTIEARLWVPGRWDEEKKTWIPLLEKARKVVPNIDEERVVKWVQDGAVELVVEEVGYVSKVPAFVGKSGTRTPPSVKISKTTLREVVLYINGIEKYRFYIPNKLVKMRNVVKLAELLNKYVTDYLEAASTVAKEVEFDVLDMEKLIGGEKVKSTYTAASDEDVETIEVQLLDTTCRGWILEPGKTYQIVTEWVRIPPDMLPKDAKLRSSFRRVGWDGQPANIDPGFEGHIIFTIYSLPDAPPLVIEEGARIVQVRLYKLERPLLGYRGQYQGV